MKNKHLGIYLLLILPPLFWAGNSVLARGVAELIPPVAMSFWRWVLALLILLPFTWKQTRSDWSEIKKYWKIIFLLGLFGIASFNTLLYTAAHSTTAINIALTQSVMPVVIVLISFILFRDKITSLQLFAIALCTLGAGYIVIRGDWQRLLQLEFVIGDLIMLLAVCLYALYSVLLRKRPDIHAMSFLTTTFAVGVVLLLPLYLWEQQTVPPLELTQPVIISLLYVAFCPSILSYLFWNRGIQEIGANRAGLYINLIPLFASLLAVLFLGEQFQNYHLVGIVLITSGLLLFNLLSLRSKG
ncbi:MAG: DMT family transporter [Thermodesulfobacteriota bacterium]|nr:DMT family transporter [Thermodesulfobacteriota bacterium]